VVQAPVDPQVKLVEENSHAYLQLTVEATVPKAKTTLVTTELLGKAKIPSVPYENADGSPLKVDIDYFAKPRNPANPTPGPFENPGQGMLKLKVW
jgi:alpha-L-arabinofuranosidase